MGENHCLQESTKMFLFDHDLLTHNLKKQKKHTIKDSLLSLFISQILTIHITYIVFKSK